MATIDLVETRLLEDKIRCPNPHCKGINYLSYNELYDEEWISLQCECLDCHTLFQINYRAVGIDLIKGEKKL
jgi:hypothetical protein